MFDGLSGAFTFATNTGDIGFWATGKIPYRKSIKDSLYIRNGQSSLNDWSRFFPPDDNPQVINPKDGYITGCSGRVNPLIEAFHSIGTTAPYSAQNLRSDKLINSMLKRSKELDKNHIEILQSDTGDEFADIIASKLIPIVEKYKTDYYDQLSKEFSIIEEMLRILPSWTNKMQSDSKYALIYSMWHREVVDFFFHHEFPKESQRKYILENPFSDYFLGSLVNSWAEGKELDNDYCKHEFNKYESKKCVYNIVKGLIKGYNKIIEKFSTNTKNWKWGYDNMLEYPHVQLSNCCLTKFLYARKTIASVLFYNFREVRIVYA